MGLVSACPEETLFSRFVRQLTISGVSRQEFQRRVFKKERISIHPYLTAGLREAANSRNQKAEDLFYSQTLGGYFSHFLPKYADKILSYLVSDNACGATRSVQLACFRESEKLALKFCPECACQDIKRYGFSYWHIAHQIPGIEACSLHQCWLYREPLPARFRIRHGLLPAWNLQKKRCTLLAAEYAAFAQRLINDINRNRKAFNYHELRSKLTELGYVTSMNRARRQRLSRDIYWFASKLQHPSNVFLPKSPTDYKYVVGLCDPNTTQNPSKIMFLSFWLDKQGSSTSSEATTGFVRNNSEKMRTVENKSIALLKEGCSLSKASRITGKSYCYLKRLAEKNGIPVLSRPTKITSTVRKDIITLATKGFHRRVIANTFHLSTGSVEQVISSVSGLVEWRKKCKFESRRRKHSVRIIRATLRHPDASKSEIKLMESSAFYWLYLHEKHWLNEILPKPKLASPNPRVDWAERDKELSLRIGAVMNKYDYKISRTQLDAEFGGHGWLTKKKHFFPNTMLVFEKLTSAKKS